MDERFVRVSAYAGKNCCPLKIRGLDPEKDLEEAMAAVERLFARPWGFEVSESVKMGDVLIITKAAPLTIRNATIEEGKRWAESKGSMS